MQRYCICGQYIKSSYQLCAKCFKLYGRDRKVWPEWLQEWLKSYQAELDRERNHHELTLHEETCNPNKCGRKIKAKRSQFDYNYDDEFPGKRAYLSNADMSILYPGSPYDLDRNC